MASSRVVLALVSTLTLAASARAARAGDGDDLGDLRSAYANLRDNGCDVSKVGSPLAARVLRNVPYALGGKIFKAPELTRVFSLDGDWYAPTTKKDPALSTADRTCIRALTTQEQKLRKKQKKIPAGIELAVTADRAAMVQMVNFVSTDFPKVRTAVTRSGDQTEYTLAFETPSGESESAVVFTCTLPTAQAKKKAPDWSTITCSMMTAG
ncbi:MAG: YARHG domain-containing protein [Kofleriaceae bacterium]|nr:YARHG domain-containing protein [Kofleriaceae bacterium]